MEKFTPYSDRVLVARADVQETTKGGLFIPRSSQEKPLRGAVIEVGPNCKHTSLGSTVLFGKYSGQFVSLNHEEYVLLREEEILGVVETT